jgi:hypothetical protein
MDGGIPDAYSGSRGFAPPTTRREVAVPDRQPPSWTQRLLGALSRRPARVAADRVRVADADGGRPSRVEAAIALPAPSAAREPGWREFLRAGDALQVAWTLVGGPRDGESADVRARVRTVLGDDVWLWFEQELPPEGIPPSGQAVVLRVSRPDGLRLIPARVVEDSRGGSLLVAIGGRVVRLQRRDHARAAVSLPPVSAIRLAPNGAPMGVLGVELIDVSGGGVQLQTAEPLRRDDVLRLNLHLDDGPPIQPIVAIVETRPSGLLVPVRAHGHFGALPEREQRRIVQFVYRREIEARRAAGGGPAD